MYKTWACKIGVKGDLQLPPGSDLPMRQAIKEAFYKLTGVDHDFCFSGWAAELNDVEKCVVDKS